MYTRKAFSPHYIKRIFQELYFSYIRYNNLFTVHFKEEFAFYEPSYWLLYTLDTTFGFTEYQRSVCLISNRMFTSFRFLSSSLVWYSPVEDLKNLLGTLLGAHFEQFFVYYVTTQIFVYQIYYTFPYFTPRLSIFISLLWLTMSKKRSRSKSTTYLSSSTIFCVLRRASRPPPLFLGGGDNRNLF